MYTVVVISALFAACSASSLHYNGPDDVADMKQIWAILSKHRVPERFRPETVNKQYVAPRVSAFKWTNCGSSSDMVQVHSLSLSPDPIKLPGTITASANATISATFGMPLSAELKIEKKVLFWVPIPCVDNIGSCSYDNLCSLLASVQCPDGLPCHCPFKAGNYNIAPVSVDADIENLPSWLSNGDYRVTAHLSSGGKEAACLSLTLSLTSD